MEWGRILTLFCLFDVVPFDLIFASFLFISVHVILFSFISSYPISFSILSFHFTPFLSFINFLRFNIFPFYPSLFPSRSLSLSCFSFIHPTQHDTNFQWTAQRSTARHDIAHHIDTTSLPLRPYTTFSTNLLDYWLVIHHPLFIILHSPTLFIF